MNIFSKNKDFIIKNEKLIAYTGNEEIIEIPKDIKVIDGHAFADNKTIKEIKLHKDINTIKNNAFFNCTSLEKINLENVTKIGFNAFSYCKNLKNINLNNLKIIENSAFDSAGIEKVIIPKTVINTEEDISRLIFFKCKQLKEAEINCEIYKNDMQYIFENSNIEKLIINNNSVFDIKQYGIMPELKEIEINNPLYKIKDGMIYSADEKELIYCPPNLEIVEYRIPNNVKILKANCFECNRNIKKLYIGEKVEKIEDCVFTKANINKIIFNKNLKKIDNNIFKGTNVKTIDLSNTEIDELDLMKTGIYNWKSNEVIPSIENIIIPNKLVNLYCYPYIYIKKETMQSLKINQPKELFSKLIQELIEDYNIQLYNKTLEELIEEGKTFYEASQIIKEQER